MSDHDRPEGEPPEDDAVVTPVPAEGEGESVIASVDPETREETRPVWSDQADADADERTVVDEPTKSQTAGDEAIEIVKTIVYALLIAFVLRTLLFQPFTIPSASMEPNLYEGDYLVVSKWNYGYSRHSTWPSLPFGEGRLFNHMPRRGDIIVFKWPGDDKTDYIKRVIGLPGDTLQMRANQLYINGRPTTDVVQGTRLGSAPWGERDALQVRETLPGGRSFMTQDFGDAGELDDTEVFSVPEGYYFMMGDNRDNSLDSRAPVAIRGVGFVKAENLEGKAQIVLFSWTPGASLIKPWTWFTHVRFSRFFHLLK